MSRYQPLRLRSEADSGARGFLALLVVWERGLLARVATYRSRLGIEPGVAGLLAPPPLWSDAAAASIDAPSPVLPGVLRAAHCAYQERPGEQHSGV